MFIASMLRDFLDMLSGAMTLLKITLKLTKKLEKYLKGSCKSFRVFISHQQMTLQIYFQTRLCLMFNLIL